MKMTPLPLCLLVIAFALTGCGKSSAPSIPETRSASAVVSGPVKVTILSTMLATRGIGEWGFSALVEVGDRRILFDTGNRPETVLQNATEMGVDWNGVDEVVQITDKR